ncbi:immunoglobulin-binding protein 1 [Atheta coriaria]|uniref:immunoglobulin-binding protein 1 n=1 Tax=Dalotia coriaria TaxID=877792 RepID=UPI0031F3B045
MATALPDSAPPPEKTLAQLFTEGLNLFNNLGKIDEPTNSPNVQINVRKAMTLLEDATRLASMANIFSRNEAINEIPTEHIQYLLLPALLGSLTLQLTCGERKNIIATADTYFRDFLQRCNDYGLSDHKFSDNQLEPAKPNESQAQGQSQMDMIVKSVNTRASKIQRFKDKKELQEKLVVLKENLNNEHVDDEIKRDYFLTLVKTYIYEAVDELQSIDMEKPILDHIEKMGPEMRKQPKIPVKPLKPIIITRDEIQKAVYGAGYPSLPTMTVAEFYDKRVRDGIFPDPNKPKTGPMSMQEAALAGISLNNEDKEAEEKENLEEADDEDFLASERARDEYKDDHRRGWGNRMNRS